MRRADPSPAIVPEFRRFATPRAPRALAARGFLRSPAAAACSAKADVSCSRGPRTGAVRGCRRTVDRQNQPGHRRRPRPRALSPVPDSMSRPTRSDDAKRRQAGRPGLPAVNARAYRGLPGTDDAAAQRAWADLRRIIGLALPYRVRFAVELGAT